MYLCPKCESFIEDDELENTNFNCPYCANETVVKCRGTISGVPGNYAPNKKFLIQFEKEYGVAFDGNNSEHAWIKEEYFKSLEKLKEI